jgi:flagellar biosynthesis chaperone FliJ
LNNWQTATLAASLAETEVWKDLQNSKATAELELEQCKNTWRSEACDLAQKVLDQLAYDHRVKEAFKETSRAALIEPLQKFITVLEKETRVETLANATSRIEYLQRQIAQAVEEAWKKKQSARKKPVKPVEIIRLSEVLRITTIQDSTQWEELRDRLDQTVRQALDQGHDVHFE